MGTIARILKESIMDDQDEVFGAGLVLGMMIAAAIILMFS